MLAAVKVERFVPPFAVGRTPVTPAVRESCPKAGFEDAPVERRGYPVVLGAAKATLPVPLPSMTL